LTIQSQRTTVIKEEAEPEPQQQQSDEDESPFVFFTDIQEKQEELA